MKLIRKALVELWHLMGPGRDYLYVASILLCFMIHFLFMRFFLCLDHLFFYGFRNIQVEKPVFIIGHPRSGTTFVQNLFSQTHETAAFKAWHILFPSLTARVLVRPAIDFLIRKNRTDLIPREAGHHIALNKTEEEEILFLNVFDTQFLTTATPLGFLEDDFRDLRFHDLQPRKQRITSARFLKTCFQRQIYYTKNPQIVAQTHYSTHRIKTLMEVFPDAKFIFIDRNPGETLPSYFSLLWNIMDLIWGMNRFSPNLVNRFFAHRYNAAIDLYGYFYGLLDQGDIDDTRVLIIRYTDLLEDLTGAFEKMVSFTEIEPSRKLKAAVFKQALKQKHFRRGHVVKPLADFGIDTNRVKTDFSFH